jgi:hypothetical protein
MMGVRTLMMGVDYEPRQSGGSSSVRSSGIYSE